MAIEKVVKRIDLPYKEITGFLVLNGYWFVDTIDFPERELLLVQYI